MNIRANKYTLFLIAILILVIVPLIIFLIISGFSQKSSTSQLPSFPSPSVALSQPRNPTPSSSLTQEQKMQLQTEADKAYGDYFTQVGKDYPWFSKLPIRTDDYFIFFNLESKRFGGYLYPTTTSSESVDTQTARLKEAVLARLNALEVDMSRYQIDWKIFVK